MAGWRRAVELAMTDEEIATLRGLSRSRSEPASRVSPGKGELHVHHRSPHPRALHQGCNMDGAPLAPDHPWNRV
jgi:hypothetical protein